ncbi:MAG: hypothetical protein LUQ29_00210, partial [Methylococcaceae bacterium]|nr:hypothetical protein [Methylococcaceae bacterium]
IKSLGSSHSGAGEAKYATWWMQNECVPSIAIIAKSFSLLKPDGSCFSFHEKSKILVRLSLLSFST